MLNNKTIIDSPLLNGIVKGAILEKAYASTTYLNYLQPYVAEGPEEAFERIEQFFQTTPRIDGNNISGIIAIRDSLFELCDDKAHINSLSLMASHTHWEEKRPIIYHYLPEKDYYVIGEHPIEPNADYTPVSFVFSESGLFPYEWAHPSVKINQEEWKIVFDIGKKLNTKLHNKQYPIGICIDFRFKQSLFEISAATVEQGIRDKHPDYQGFSYIIPLLERNATTPTEGDTIQVSWHSRSDKLYAFSKEEKTALSALRKELEGMNNQERLAYIQELEGQL